ncbi:MAG: 50S ribosomal protein L22 [Anaerolineae bacterium]|nr:50S ribosomal protein L22 [Anaerolineae bacterium]NIN97907.1 50S ribosomal protein L22 [Anaerolineae bacterium]NIQ80886.1 50S ribosomal protein L22 [Anaerolineae bacterium]
MGLEIKAVERFIPMSPHKTRRVIDLVRERPVDEALALLRFLPQAAAKPVTKAIESAAANAEDVHGLSKSDLYISQITADVGPTLKRFRAGARGRVKPILKRGSHITVVLSELEEE